MSIEGLLFLLAALLCCGGGLAHSIFGELYVIKRLSASSDLSTFSDPTKTAIYMVRGIWHLLTIGLWAIAILLFLMAQAPLSTATVAFLLAATFLVSSIFVVVAARSYHLAWIGFLVIAILTSVGVSIRIPM